MLMANNIRCGTSPVVQWLRLCSPMLVAWVRFLVGNQDPTCHGVWPKSEKTTQQNTQLGFPLPPAVSWRPRVGRFHRECASQVLSWGNLPNPGNFHWQGFCLIPLGPLVSHAAGDHLPGHLSMCLHIPQFGERAPAGRWWPRLSYPLKKYLLNK